MSKASARALSDQERGVLVALIERGVDSTSATAVTAADRQRWLARVSRTRVVGRCACGSCPSVELATTGAEVDEGGTLVVLEAHVPEAVLLLFIDGDQLSYLELAPIDPDVAVAEFPPAESITAAL